MIKECGKRKTSNNSRIKRENANQKTEQDRVAMQESKTAIKRANDCGKLDGPNE